MLSKAEYLYFLILAFAHASMTSVVPVSQSFQSHNAIRQNSPQLVCGFEGNSDIYGLGIRLGLYLQWVAAYFTCQTLPESTPDLVDITAIFEFALLVATAVLTKNSTTTHAIEILILIVMFTADLWLVHIPISLSLLAHPTAGLTVSPAGMCLRTLMTFAMASFAAWFTYRGCFNYLRDPCGTWLLTVFFKRRLINWMPGLGRFEEHKNVKIRDPTILWFWLVTFINLVLVVIVGIILFVIPTGGQLDTDMPVFQKRVNLQSIVRILQVPLGQQDARWRRFAGSENNSREARRILRYILPILFSFAVLNIELILKWNSISGIYSINSTGQLIPLILGIGSLSKVFNQALTKYLVGLDRLNNNSPSHAEESTELQLHNTEATRSAAETSANLDQASDLQVGRSA